MANKYVINNSSLANRERAKRHYFNALRRYANHHIKTQEALLQEFFRAVHDFFARLGKPAIDYGHLIAPESPPDSDKYNETMQAICDDINISYVEQNAIEDGLLSNFNYSQTERLRLERILQETKDHLDVYTIMSKSRESNEIWLTDSFKTMAKIDTDATISAERAHVNTDGGYITLPRARSDRVWDTIDDIESIRVETPNLPDTSAFTSPATDRIEATGTSLERIKQHRREINWEDHYQGKMYGIINQSGSVLGEDGIRSDEGAIGAQATAPLYKVLFPDNQNTVDTFWEYELVILSGEEGQWTEIAPVEEITNQSTGTTRRVLTEELRRGFITIDPRLEYSSGKTTDTYVWSQESKPDANTEYSLEVNLIITLKEPKHMNSLSIEPHTFGHQVYPSLSSIATASEGSGTFVPLPYFSQQNLARMKDVSIDKLKKNYISMSAMQHFTFPTREVKSLKISFIQDTPYQIGYTMGLASRNWIFRYTKPDRSSDIIEYTEYAWVDILGKEFMRGLTDIVRSEVRTGVLEYSEFERRFETLTDIDITGSSSVYTVEGSTGDATSEEQGASYEGLDYVVILGVKYYL